MHMPHAQVILVSFVLFPAAIPLHQKKQLIVSFHGTFLRGTFGSTKYPQKTASLDETKSLSNQSLIPMKKPTNVFIGGMSLFF